MACATPWIRSSALTEEIAVPTMFEKIWNRHVVAEGPGGTVAALHRPPPAPRGRDARLRASRSGRALGAAARPASWPPPITTCRPGRARRPSPTTRSAAWSRSSTAHTARAGHHALRAAGTPRTGIVHVIGPEQGLTQPGITARLRRLAHRDPRSLRRARLRHRLDRGRARAGHPVPLAEEAARRCASR